MDKEKFLKELKYQLRYLNKETIDEELKNYENLPDYNLKPEDEANKIYQKRGLNVKVTKKTSLFDAISKIIDAIKSKNKKIITDLVLFFVYIFILIKRMHQPAQEMLLHSQYVENAWNMEWLLTQLLDLLSDKLLQLQHHLAHLHLLRYKCCYQLILQHGEC